MAHGYCSNASNFVDILKGQPEGLVGRPGGWDDGVKGVQEGGSRGVTLLTLDLPALVPGHILGGLQHVVSMPSGDGDEGNSSWVVANLLDEALDLLLDLLKPGLRVWGLSGVHLDDTTMSGGINDGDIVLASLELPEGDINGDTTLTLSLQLVQNPGVLEGALAHLLGFLLEFLDGTLVDATALVDQVTGGGGLAGVDVSNHDNVDVSLLGSSHLARLFKNPCKESNRVLRQYGFLQVPRTKEPH